MKILVVGAVAGGATAIARLRRLNEDAEIIIFEREKYVSYANCGLPYYVGGVIEERDALFVSDEDSIRAKYNIDIRVESEVISIDREGKKVKVKSKEKGEYEETYDKLLLSTGSSPFVPKVDGMEEADNVFKVWTVPDVDKISEFIKNKKPKKAIVVGGGFIGLEMAENLAEKGMEVTVADMADQVMPPFDKDMAKIIVNHLVNKGVKLLLSDGFSGIENAGKIVAFSSGKKVETDLVILSIGVRPNNQLAKDAGLELSERGGVRVDEFGQTSDPDIYAVGDVVNVKDYVLGGDTMIPLAGPANKQGRAVAANILGMEKEEYIGTIGTSVAKIFDLTVASTGANEKSLQRAGKEYGKDYLYTIISPMSHAGYYPEALPMTMKMIFSVDGKVLGAQIVGYDGVDKRIDTLSAAIHFKGSVKDLTQLEFAYAPPYSSAKDPVNFLGYVADNILKGISRQIRYEDLVENKEGYTLLDIRDDDEVMIGMIDGSVHIPLPSLRDRISELDKDKNYAIMCAAGIRGYVAERILKQKGFKASTIMGGFRMYNDQKEDITSPRMGETTEVIVNTEESKFNKPVSNKLETLNVCGLSCPGPIVQVAKKMESLKEGDTLEVVATDPGFTRDIDSWAKNTGNTLLSRSQDGGKYKATLVKGTSIPTLASTGTKEVANNKKEKTMIIFDGDLDKAIASFIIANGAAAMGNKVHMFFTFWGLSIIRKPNANVSGKDFMSKMFAAMLPKGSKKLKLSQMNFLGAGPKMIRGVMKNKGVSSLEELIKQAQESGVEMTACQMSMDIMGLTQEELIDGVEVGGVASMLDDNDNSNMNLFI